jgi:hypothetical protein
LVFLPLSPEVRFGGFIGVLPFYIVFWGTGALVITVVLAPFVAVVYWLWCHLTAAQPAGFLRLHLPAIVLSAAFALAAGLSFASADELDIGSPWPFGEKVLFVVWLFLAALAGVLLPQRLGWARSRARGVSERAV